MKIKFAALVCAICIPVACILPSNVDRGSLSFVGLYTNTQEEIETPDSTLELDKFYVNFEIVVFAEEIKKYPVTWSKAQEAIVEWGKHLPVRIVTYVEDPLMINPFVGPMIYHNRPGVIKLHLDNLQGSAYRFGRGLLGLWHSQEQSILLDADVLETLPEIAYSVTLHELGHVFGIPHVVGFSDEGLTGFIILEEGTDAKNYVMYPRYVKDHEQKILSALEIQLARHGVTHNWTQPDRFHGIKDNCSLFMLDK